MKMENGKAYYDFQYYSRQTTMIYINLRYILSLLFIINYYFYTILYYFYYYYVN